MSFHVGQKVVCVSRFETWQHTRGFGIELPSYKEIYTVRHVGKLFASNGLEYPAIWLCELLNAPVESPRNGCIEIGFWASWFRPLEYKAMEIFRRIAANPKIEIREDA